MKRLSLLFLGALLAFPALAEEVVLEAENTDWPAILMARGVNPKDGPVRYEKATPPEEAKTPDGALNWGRLHVGKKSHLLCMKMRGPQEGCLWLDRDGDLDFQEETPVETVMMMGRIPSFQLEAVPGEFEVGGGTLPLKMNLQVLPMLSEIQGLVFLNTAMRGTIEMGGQALSLRWFPGGKPHVVPAIPLLRSIEISSLRIGPKEIAASETLTLVEGELRGSYTALDRTDGVACKAPTGLGCVMTYAKGSMCAYFPAEGMVHLPGGNISQIQYLYSGASKLGEYDLAVLGTELNVEEGLSLEDHGNVKVGLSMKKQDGKAVFSASMTSKTGLRIQVFKDGVPLSATPTLCVRDGNGQVLVKHQFESG